MIALQLLTVIQVIKVRKGIGRWRKTSFKTVELYTDQLSTQPYPVFTTKKSARRIKPKDFRYKGATWREYLTAQFEVCFDLQ
jgi:hypothetical protein